MENKRTFITCEVPAGLLEDVDYLANKYHVKRSDIIRQSLYEFCEFYSHDNNGDGSIFEYYKGRLNAKWQ